MPRALWRDRLLRFKRAGFNCVEVYTFWNWHEPQEGKFDFTGDHDLDAYLKLVHEMGMYAICRVGPYYCAEWDSGGYPLWLRFKPGLRVREDDPPFLNAVDHFFDRLIPIVAANQISRGGSVILVQLENEGASWGTDEAEPLLHAPADQGRLAGPGSALLLQRPAPRRRPRQRHGDGRREPPQPLVHDRVLVRLV